MKKNRLSELINTLPPQAVLQDADALFFYTTEQRGHFISKPLAVVLPSSTQDVQTIVRFARQYHLKLVPQGGNTGLVGGAVADQHSLIINCQHMNNIINVDSSGDSMQAEAGCTLAQVKAAADAQNLYFPLGLSVAETCQIGGNIASNAGGINVLKYGNMRNLVLGLEVVLADGSIWSDLRPLHKNNAGIDLKHLFIGSEGTLGLITKATLRLFPKPRHITTYWYPCSSISDTIDAYRKARQFFGDSISACELLPDIALHLVRQYRSDAVSLQDSAPWYVLLETQSQHSDQFLKTDDFITIPAGEAAHYWYYRRQFPWVQREAGISIKHDIALPLDAIAAFVEYAADALKTAYPEAIPTPFGHLGDGNLHYNILFAKNATPDTAGIHKMIYDLVHRYGGTISAEHGIGLAKRDLLYHYEPEIAQQLRSAVKNALDPAHLFNPGKTI